MDYFRQSLKVYEATLGSHDEKTERSRKAVAELEDQDKFVIKDNSMAAMGFDEDEDMGGGIDIEDDDMGYDDLGGLLRRI